MKNNSPVALGHPLPPADERAAFPYQKTFNAIAAATKVEAGHIAISVADFCKAFGAAAPQAGATLTDEQIASVWLRTTGFNECDVAQDVIGFARALLATTKE